MRTKINDKLDDSPQLLIDFSKHNKHNKSTALQKLDICDFI